MKLINSSDSSCYFHAQMAINLNATAIRKQQLHFASSET